jgi:hypothetical protein
MSTRDGATFTRTNLCEPNVQGVRKGFPLRGAFDRNSDYHPEAPGFSLTRLASSKVRSLGLQAMDRKGQWRVDGRSLSDLHTHGARRLSRGKTSQEGAYCGSVPTASVKSELLTPVLSHGDFHAREFALQLYISHARPCGGYSDLRP